MTVRRLTTPIIHGDDVLTHCRVVEQVNDAKRRCLRTVYDLGTLDGDVFVPRHRFHADAEDSAALEHRITKAVVLPASTAYTAASKVMSESQKMNHLEALGRVGPGTQVQLPDPVVEEIEP